MPCPSASKQEALAAAFLLPQPLATSLIQSSHFLLAPHGKMRVPAEARHDMQALIQPLAALVVPAFYDTNNAPCFAIVAALF
jgi:hypothetical protein